MNPTLRFSPTAWAKLLFLRDLGKTEVGMFAITHEEDPLFVVDLRMIDQKCTWATIKFTDDGVADFFDTMIEEGYEPVNFFRIWIHTHPGSSPSPSFVDEETFARVFDGCDWSVMAILAKGGDTYARLKFTVAEEIMATEIPMVVDYDCDFEATDRLTWKAEYDAHVSVERTVKAGKGKGLNKLVETKTYIDELEEMTDAEKRDEEAHEALLKQFYGDDYGDHPDDFYYAGNGFNGAWIS